MIRIPLRTAAGMSEAAMETALIELAKVGDTPKRLLCNSFDTNERALDIFMNTPLYGNIYVSRSHMGGDEWQLIGEYCYITSGHKT